MNKLTITNPSILLDISKEIYIFNVVFNRFLLLKGVLKRFLFQNQPSITTKVL